MKIQIYKKGKASKRNWTVWKGFFPFSCTSCCFHGLFTSCCPFLSLKALDSTMMCLFQQSSLFQNFVFILENCKCFGLIETLFLLHCAVKTKVWQRQNLPVHNFYFVKLEKYYLQILWSNKKIYQKLEIFFARHSLACWDFNMYVSRTYMK